MIHGLPPEQTANWLAVLLPPRSFSGDRLTVGNPAGACVLREQIGPASFCGPSAKGAFAHSSSAGAIRNRPGGAWSWLPFYFSKRIPFSLPEFVQIQSPEPSKRFPNKTQELALITSVAISTPAQKMCNAINGLPGRLLLIRLYNRMGYRNKDRETRSTSDHVCYVAGILMYQGS
jgi:hypothetical protein